jgi:ATP adenylyltransferase
MDRIWAPWRMEYITSTKDQGEKGCFLCLNETDDEKLLVLAREPTAFAIMNKYPYANGHVMVVPNRHVGRIEYLTDEELLDMMRLVRMFCSVLKEEQNTDGLNVGINMGRAAGAGLEEHIHIHVVPRWFGDTNFMPVVGETKVISEHIETTYRRLKGRIAVKNG